MDADTLEREWSIITDFLPSDWEELAWTTGALKRARKVSDPDTLLLLIMLNAAAGLSLRQATARADRMGIASISDVALMKRIQNAEAWLAELARQMFRESRFDHEAGSSVTDRRVRVVDATNISEPGSTGTDWRLHYALRLPSLSCDYVELTDQHGGETYDRLPTAPGDIILGDRGYCHREGVASVVDEDADVVVRLTWNTFPLEDTAGEPVSVLDRLGTLEGYTPDEWPVWFEAFDRTYEGRLCAIQKSDQAAARAKRRLQKGGTDPRPETLTAAEYVFVLTTLSRDTIGTADVLELFRARWQVELAFKRQKSLFDLGYVPKYDEDSARAWIYAKLVALLLIERLSDAADFFPWGYDVRPT